VNFLESLLETVKGPTPAPHVGEAFHLWAYYTALTHARSICLVLLNHTPDQEIRQTLEHFLDEVVETQLKAVSEMMKTEGIPFPAVVADHPKADEAGVPFGAKFADSEIMNMLVVKFEGLIALCNVTLATIVRDDLALLFIRFHTQLLTQSFTVKRTMQKRGWMMVPPRYVGHTTARRPTP
jgi:hypothetical protein